MECGTILKTYNMKGDRFEFFKAKSEDNIYLNNELL